MFPTIPIGNQHGTPSMIRYHQVESPVLEGFYKSTHNHFRLILAIFSKNSIREQYFTKLLVMNCFCADMMCTSLFLNTNISRISQIFSSWLQSLTLLLESWELPRPSAKETLGAIQLHLELARDVERHTEQGHGTWWRGHPCFLSHWSTPQTSWPATFGRWHRHSHEQHNIVAVKLLKIFHAKEGCGFLIVRVQPSLIVTNIYVHKWQPWIFRHAINDSHQIQRKTNSPTCLIQVWKVNTYTGIVIPFWDSKNVSYPWLLFNKTSLLVSVISKGRVEHPLNSQLIAGHHNVGA